MKSNYTLENVRGACEQKIEMSNYLENTLKNRFYWE